MPKVSVIVPIYGVEKYIERCARSLFEQTLDDMEYIFVDDCSPDKSVEILNCVKAEYAERLGNVKIIRHAENRGLAQARQSGIKIATGEYVAHCDSDDWVDLDLYERAYEKAQKDDLDVVVCNGKNTDGTRDKIIKSERHKSVSKCINAMMHRRMWWSLCNKLIRRDIYNHDIIKPQDNMGEDMCLTLQLMTYCKSIGFVASNYYYYQNPISIMRNISVGRQKESYNQICRNISRVKSLYSQRGLFEKYRRGLNYLMYNASFVLLPVLQDEECKKLWCENIRKVAFGIIADNNALIKERVRAIYFITKIV